MKGGRIFLMRPGIGYPFFSGATTERYIQEELLKDTIESIETLSTTRKRGMFHIREEDQEETDEQVHAGDQHTGLLETNGPRRTGYYSTSSDCRREST